MQKPRREYLRVGDDTIYYEVRESQGGQTPIVLCDGLGCDGFVWRYIEEFFSNHSLIHVHYRGHGRSPAPRELESLTVEQLSKDVLAVLAHEGIDVFVVMGHSLGVQVGLEIANRAPEQVKQLVLLCGASRDLTINFYRGLIPLDKILPYATRAVTRVPLLARRIAGAMFSTKWAVRIAKMVEVNGERLHDEDMAPYFRGLARIEPQVFWGLLANAAGYEPPGIDTLPIPALVVAGTADRFIPVEESRRLAGKLPHAQLCILEGGSHVTPLEFPREVCTMIEKFLRRPLPSSAKL